MFLTTSNGTKQSGSNFVPLFNDLVHLIETVDKKKVDYIILCFRDAVSTKYNEVIALQSGNIRKQLEKRHIKIYQYAGEDYFLPNFQRMQQDLKIDTLTSINGDNIEMEMQVSAHELPMEQRMDFIIPAFLCALKYQNAGSNYAATQLVQFMIELFGDYYMEYIYHIDKLNLTRGCSTTKKPLGDKHFRAKYDIIGAKEMAKTSGKACT